MSTSSAGPVWAKRVGGADIDPANITYCAGRDVAGRPAADLALIPHDLNTNAAHAIMLREQEVLEPAEAKAILAALLKVRVAADRGETILDPACEDVHMSIEQKVTALAGAGAGGRLHTGRSRNDQVATDMRLWMRETAARFVQEFHELADSLLQQVKNHAATVCPGFTHMQPAMVTTWGHLLAGYAARVLRDIRHLRQIIEELDECPLGGAASFGTSWPINRERTAELLGFARPTPSSVDPTWSRGEIEGRLVFALAQAMAHLSGMGQDLILLSSPPRHWIALSPAHTTGSSIMPQKRNPDFAEVTRAKAAVLAGMAQSLLGIAHAAPSGYNRDSQWTKYLVMDASAECAGAAPLFANVFRELSVDAEAMRTACSTGFLEATDIADFLARTRMLPFRDCYRIVGTAVKRCEADGHLSQEELNRVLGEMVNGASPLDDDEWRIFADPLLLVKQRTATGGPNPERVLEAAEMLQIQVQREVGAVFGKREAWEAASAKLWKTVELLQET